jgi:hypothetical protein
MKDGHINWITGSIFVVCWFGTGIAELVFFPGTYGTIGFALGLFGGGFLAKTVAVYLSKD